MLAHALASSLALAPPLALLSAGVVALMTRIGVLDRPGARSSHLRPTPKGGGVGIMLAVLAGTAAVGARGMLPPGDLQPAAALLLGGTLLAAVAYLDDVRDWPFAIKLAAQLVAATIAATGFWLHVVVLPGGATIDLGWTGLVITIGWVLLAVNAVNFIDGINGLASGTCGITGCILAGFAARAGDGLAAALALFLAAGILGFLPFNYPRARIFMGDVGSQFCGFLLAELGVLAASRAPAGVPVATVPLLLSGVLFDVLFTLLRRARAGERLTEAHRSHLYQVAHRSGIDAARITALYWAMAGWGGICAALAATGTRFQSLGALLLAVLPQVAWWRWVRRAAHQAGIAHW